MHTPEYPKITSKVEITFIDASPNIINYLTREAGETGFLVLRNGGGKSWSIPVEQIKEIEVTAEGVEK